MSYSRYTGEVKPFAVDAPTNRRTKFNSTASSNDVSDNLNDDYFKGWEVIGDSAPSIQDMNAVGYTQGYLISYLYEKGVPEWTNTHGYLKGNFCSHDGKIYSCLVGDKDNRCYNRVPKTDKAYWKEVGLLDTNSDNVVGSSFYALWTFHDSVLNSEHHLINYTMPDIGASNTFTQSNGYFTCPIDGIYSVEGYIAFSVETTVNNVGTQELLLFKNDSALYRFPFDLPTNKKHKIPVRFQQLVELKVGDRIALGYSGFLSSFQNKIYLTNASFMAHKI